MLSKDVGYIKDVDTQEQLRYIFENAQGNIIELGGVPDETKPRLLDKEVGVYDSVLYWRNGSTILVFTPSSTITITNDEV